MASRSAQPRADGMVTVRLSQVPADLRVSVAALIVQKSGCGSDLAIDWFAAAAGFGTDPVLEVPAWKAEVVLAGKLPGGDMPPVWRW